MKHEVPLSNHHDDATTRGLRKRIHSVEWQILVWLVILAGGVWAFAELADEVLEGDTKSFDEQILLALRTPTDVSDPIGPHWVEELMRDFTALGGMGVLTFLSLTIAGFLWIQQKKHTLLFLILAVGGGIIFSSLLKYGFDRPRPDLVPHGGYVYTTSFPSGHSMMSAITYLSLAALLTRIDRRRRVKIYFMSIALALTLTVGVSRIYLGVHWPTDVLAGWTMGALWALAVWLAVRKLQRKGQIEMADENTQELQRRTQKSPG